MMIGATVEQPPVAFLTPRAHEIATARNLPQFEPDPAVFSRINEITTAVDERYTITAANGLAIVVRSAEGRNPRDWDVRYSHADMDQPYTPATELERSPGRIPREIPKEKIMRSGRLVLEISVWEGFDDPFGPMVASAIMGASYHPRQGIAAFTIANLDGSPGVNLNPWQNVRRVLAVQKVRKEGLLPFKMDGGPSSSDVVRQG